jgi:hypothetical protein
MVDKKMVDEKVVFDEYIHIDNGGYRFRYSMSWDGNQFVSDGLQVSNSFYGYSDNIMTLNHLSADDMEKLGRIFLAAADRIRKPNTI